MWPRRQHQFREVVDRQLAIFAAEHDQLVTDARAALHRYQTQPDPSRAQEHYGEHDELAEQVEELLDDMYRYFAATLEPGPAKAYRRQFTRRARTVYGDLLPRLRFDPPEDQLPG